MVGRLIARFRSLMNRNRIDAEIDAELRFHVDMAIQRNRALGMPYDEARRVALRDLGGVTPTKEAVREVRTTLIETTVRDLRFAGRVLARNPGFAAAATLTLALGIGANAALFGIVDAVLLRPLPYAEPDRVVRVKGFSGQAFIGWGGPSGFDISPPELRASPAFAAMGAAVAGGLNLGVDPAERVRAASVTVGFFEALGVRAARGRTFTADENAKSAQLVVISDRFWRRRFAADPTLIGRALRLNGRSFAVTGVMPPRVDYPSASDVWIPAGADGQIYTSTPTAAVIARLAPGVTSTQARDVVARIEQSQPRTGGTPVRLSGASQQFARPPEVSIVSLRDELVGRVRPILALTASASLLVLLVACINAAHLMLSRVGAREREFAVRRALGASRGRLARQVLSESLLISFAAGVAAIPAAIWTLNVVGALIPPTLHGANDISVNTRVLVVTGLLALLTTALFGLVPAISMPGRRAGDALRGAPGVTADRFWRRFRGALVVVEIAVALVLLAGATTVARTVSRLMAVDVGVRGDHVLAVDLMLPEVNYPSRESQRQFYNRLEEALRAVPRVEVVGATNQLPGDPDPMISAERIRIEGLAEIAETNKSFALRLVATPDYFRAVGIDSLAGRSFTYADRRGTPPVAIVSEDVAAAVGLLPREIVGRRLDFGSSYSERFRFVEVVGVVRRVRIRGPEQNADPAIYVPDLGRSYSSPRIVIRAGGDPRQIIPAVRAAVARLDPALPLYRIRTFDEIRSALLADRRFARTAMSAFGGLASGLAVLGLYGLLAHLVHLRTREIGIRIALGATPSSVLGLVLWGGLRHAVGGVALGVILALASWRLVASRVPGVGPMETTVLALLAAAVLVVATVATWLPSRRATRVDPVVALRADG